jgi:hypothetical protein
LPGPERPSGAAAGSDVGSITGRVALQRPTAFGSSPGRSRERVFGEFRPRQSSLLPDVLDRSVLVVRDPFQKRPGVTSGTVVRSKLPYLRFGELCLACDPRQVREQETGRPDGIVAGECQVRLAATVLVVEDLARTTSSAEQRPCLGSIRAGFRWSPWHSACHPVRLSDQVSARRTRRAGRPRSGHRERSAPLLAAAAGSS